MTAGSGRDAATPVASADTACARNGARRWLGVLANLAYPVVILGAWRWHSPRFVGLMLLALLWTQRAAGTGALAASLRKLTKTDWAVALTLSITSIAIVLTNSEALMRFYPSLVNFGLLVAFGVTLHNGPSMIEKFARLTYADPPAHVVRYTRRVTQLWCGFFALNGVFSAWTALRWQGEAWSLYNGAIVYVVIGTLIVGEFAWRKWFVMPRAAARGEAA